MEESGSGIFSFEQLATALKHARERQNVTVEEVSRHIGISRDIIEKIESGDFDFLPGVYVLAYVKKYASLLGVGNEEYFNSFRESLLGRKESRASVSAAVSEHSGKSLFYERTVSVMSRVQDNVTPRRLLVVLAVILVLAALFVIPRFFLSGPSVTGVNDGSSADALIEADTAAVAEQVIDKGFMPLLPPADSLASGDSAAADRQNNRIASLVAMEAARSTDSARVIKAEKPKVARTLEVRIIEDQTWVKVVADDSARVYAGGLFSKGEVLRFTAEKKFWINIGRPSYVELYLDGKKLPPSTQRTLIFQ
jgi:cytoskeleton protein RodZ